MATKIKELREKAMRLHSEAQGVLAGIPADASADVASEARAKFSDMMDEFDAIKAQADAMEREARAAAAVEEMRESADRETREARRATGGAITPEGLPGHGHAQAGGGDPLASDEYRAAFGALLRSGSVSGLSSDHRALVEARAQSVGSGAGGGYTVPTGIYSQVIKALSDFTPMMDGTAITLLNTATGNAMTMPGLDDEEEAEAREENSDQDTEAEIALIKSELGAHALATKWIRWSHELATDSAFDWGSILAGLVADRLSRKAGRWLTTGTGSGQPLGLFTAAPVGHTAAAQAVLSGDDVLKAVHSVRPAYRRGPKTGWQIHDQSVLALRLLKDAEGRPLWRDGDLTKAEPTVLAGYPVKLNMDAPTIAAGAKVAVFGDQSRYFTRVSGGVRLQIATEKFAPDLGILGHTRVDGALSDPHAVRALKMAG